MDGRLKDIQRLIKKIDRLTDGQAYVNLENIDWDDVETLNSFLLVVKPNGGYYKGGKFEFRVTLPLNYPCECPPVIWCNTPVYHPNIDMEEQMYFDDTSTNVCLNLFDYGTWQPSFTLEIMVLGLIFLFHHPNLNDPLASGFPDSTDVDQYAANVRKYMAGEEVNDIKYNTGFRVIDGVMVEEWERPKNKDDTNEMETIVDSVLELSDTSVLEHRRTKSDSVDDAVKNDLKDALVQREQVDVPTNNICIFTNTSDSIFENNNDKVCSEVETRQTNGHQIDTDIPSRELEFVEIIKTEKLENCTTDRVNEYFTDEHYPIFTIKEDTENVSPNQEVDEDDADVECVFSNGEFVVKPKMIHIEEEGLPVSNETTNTCVLAVDELDFDRKIVDPDFKLGSHRKPRNFFSCVRYVLYRVSRAFRRRR